MTEPEWVKKLEEEGYIDVTVSRNGPNMKFQEHFHDRAAVNVILDGEMTMTDKDNTVVRKKGDRIEIPAGITHTVQCGPEGCTFVAGYK